MIFNRKLPVLPIMLLALTAPLFGQTAARLEALLETPALTWEEAAAFIQEAAESAPAGQWLPKNAAPGDSARLNGVALLLMRSFDLKGGIFFSIAKNPHYAYRELVYKKVIRGNTDPLMPVSGPDLLYMIGRLLAIKEEAEAAQ